jgi:adenylate cyclase
VRLHRRDFAAHFFRVFLSRPTRVISALLWRYLSVIAVTLFWLLLEQADTLRPIENLTVDARFRVRGPLPTPLNVVYVDIDTQSLVDLGNFPWERGLFARVSDVLLKHGNAKAIGIDVVFSEAGVPNIADPAKVIRGRQELGTFLRSAPPVVLAASYASGGEKGSDGEMRARSIPLVKDGPSTVAPELPQWELDGAAFTPQHIGLIDTYYGETRRLFVLTQTLERTYFTLGLELARLHYGLQPDHIQVYPDRLDLKPPAGELVRTVPLIEGQYADINWFSPWDHESNRRVSFSDLITIHDALKSGNPTDRAAVTEYFADGYFKDAIVLIGPVDNVLQDTAPTPFDRFPVPKVGVHGNMLKTIVSGRFLQHPPGWALPLITLALTTLVVLLALAAEGRGSLSLRILAGIVLLGYIGLSFAAFALFDWVLPMTVPLGAALSGAFIGGAAQLVLAQRQKSRIRGMFGAYVSPALVARMVDSGQEPSLGGIEEEITAYFSDVQSFSTFSEVLKPTQLVELMNEYLTACTDLIQAQGGTLDKYVGDAVVAIYGAPLPLANHPLKACITALGVHRRSIELRRKWAHEPEKAWPEIVTRLRTRIGLNTGRAVVGNMGSDTRFSYTMMGDNVNLAARLESGAKHWGVFTLCSESTKLACQLADPEQVVFRALGRIVVQGRQTAVPIFEVVCLKEEASERTRQCIARFEAGLERFFARDWDSALEHFADSAALEPNQPDALEGITSNPSLVYQRIATDYRSAPPPPEWDGAYVMREK